MKIMLDFFAGLHGASRAFLKDEDWQVISIDNNIDLENITHQVDIFDFYLSEEFQELKKLDIDLIWCSPPCIEFYKVLRPYFPEHFGTDPNMDLVELSIQIIDELNPKTWVIENTKSGVKFIEPILGKYRQCHGPFFLWGNFPRFEADVDPGYKAKNDKRWDKLRSNIKAKIPYTISIGLKNAIENQKTLTFL